MSGTPWTWTAQIIVRLVFGRTPSPLPVGPEQQAERAALVGDHERARGQLVGPAGELLAGRRGADPGAALGGVGVEGAQRDAGLHDRDRQRVVEQVLALELPVLHAVERHLLDGRRRAVGVEADVAVEDAVGPGDRPLAQVDRVAAVEAVGEALEALLDLARAAAGAAVDRRVAQREARELLLERRRDPARLGDGVAAQAALDRLDVLGPDHRSDAARRRDSPISSSTSATSCSRPSSSLPTSAPRRIPPG